MNDINHYHADTSHVTASMLKTLRKSPRIYEATYITKSIWSEPSREMLIGSAVHCLALEPDEFDDRYIVNPHESRRTKAYKEWAAEESREVLTLSEMHRVKRAATALSGNPCIAVALTADGKVENTFRWVCPETKVPCKFRPDKIAGRVVLDIKTTSECSEAYFTKQVADFGYHLQQAHYIAGAESCTGQPGWSFVFGVVETKPPYRCRAYRLDDEAASIGAEVRWELLTDLRSRLESGDWSEPYEQELKDISLPHWEIKRWRQNNNSN